MSSHSPDPSAPIVELLGQMDALSASDLFFAAGKQPAARIDGRIAPITAPPTSDEALQALVDRVLNEAGRETFAARGDMDSGLSLEDGRRFRLNLSRQQGRLAVVARAVPFGALSFEELGLPDQVMEFANLNRGLVLVTGATGSGKSTTLAAMIHHINSSRPVHIVTVEDPIEYVHIDVQARVSQREVGGDTAGFQEALRHVVRQSPDVILIGEMRDQETMQVALSAALTGHLVLATLHTIDATQTLQRILSYYPEHLRGQAAMDLSLSLQGVISQRLLPRHDGDGRVLATEMLTVVPAVAQLLREQRVDELQDLMVSLKGPGMRTFNTSMLDLYRAGTISFEIGMAYASNPDSFALATKGMSTGVASLHVDAADGQNVGLDMRSLLRTAMQRGASDLHLCVGRPPILRISGSLRAVGRRRLSDGDMRMLLYSVMNQRQRSIYDLEREIDFAIALDGGQRFRVNAYHQKGRTAAALRAIPQTVPTADVLRIPPTVLSLGQRAQGLVLVTGPTGSGKSTTLACLVDRINQTRPCRIITIEDPVEYTHRSVMATIDQREVYADTRSFAAALKYILRQDPDVILVGEMRDLETIQAVLTAAETGHLVLATLHANDAVQAIDRVVDVFPAHQQGQARSMLASCILGVVSQRLLPRRQGAGRVPAFEIMLGSTAIRNHIRDDKMHQAKGTIETSKAKGMITMDRSLTDLYNEGLIEYEDAIRYLHNPRAIAPPAADHGDTTDPGRPRSR